MTEEDYPLLEKLWKIIHGFRNRAVDDSKVGISRFLQRNPEMSVVAEYNGTIVGSILCGHDGRCGMLYHVCVAEAYRQQGIGKAMVEKVLEALKREKINMVTLIAFADNDIGNQFWQKMGWLKKADINYYEFVINPSNIIKINMQ